MLTNLFSSFTSSSSSTTDIEDLDKSCGFQRKECVEHEAFGEFESYQRHMFVLTSTPPAEWSSDVAKSGTVHLLKKKFDKKESKGKKKQFNSLF